MPGTNHLCLKITVILESQLLTPLVIIFIFCFLCRWEVTKFEIAFRSELKCDNVIESMIIYNNPMNNECFSYILKYIKYISEFVMVSLVTLCYLVLLIWYNLSLMWHIPLLFVGKVLMYDMHLIIICLYEISFENMYTFNFAIYWFMYI